MPNSCMQTYLFPTYLFQKNKSNSNEVYHDDWPPVAATISIAFFVVEISVVGVVLPEIADGPIREDALRMPAAVLVEGDVRMKGGDLDHQNPPNG